MKVFLIVIISLVVLLALFVAIAKLMGAKRSDFKDLTNPRIIEKSDVKVIKVDFNGDPDIVIKEAYGKLFKRYYRLKEAPKGFNQPAPIARYEDFDNITGISMENIKDNPWKGYVAIEIPESTTEISDESSLIEFMNYGLVAEIVHFGPYEEETENIKRLKDFIDESGYKISGLHEEEYIKGPGFLYTSPKNYITIIRYQIEKR